MLPAKNIALATFTFLITVFGAFLVLSFVFPKAKEPKPSFLRVVGFWDTDVFNVIKKEFQNKHPEITIEYEKKNPGRYYQNLKADLAKEKGGPDLFWWHSSWKPDLKGSLAALPESIMSQKEYSQTFYPITQTDLKSGGRFRGFPLEFDGLALLYNKTIFASRNFIEAPKTWTTLAQDYVPSLTSSNSNQIFTSAIALGSVKNVENFSDIIGLFLLQNGVEFISKEGKFTLYQEKAKKSNKLAADALNFYFSFSRRARTWDNTQPNSIEAFARGKTAMIILPLHKIHYLLTFLRSENLNLDFGVEPIPQLPDSQPVTWGSYWSIGVAEKSKKQEAAWKLAKYMVEPDSLRIIYQTETERNGFGRAYPRVEMAREQTTHPYLAAYLVGAPNAKSWYLQDDSLDSGLNRSIIDIFKKNLIYLERSSNSEGVLKNSAKEIEPLLEKYGLITKPKTK